MRTVIDALTVRRELMKLRRPEHPKDLPFARKIGVHRDTIARVEDITGDPDYQPTFDTIEKWTRACGITLSQFFGRIEQLTSPVKESLNPQHSGGTIAHDRAVQPFTGVVQQLHCEIDRLHSMLAELGAISDAVRERAESFIMAPVDERLAAAPMAAPRKHRVSRKRGGKSPSKAG